MPKTLNVTFVERGSSWDKHDRAWDKFYAERAERTLVDKLQTAILSEMSDTEFRKFVADLLPH